MTTIQESNNSNTVKTNLFTIKKLIIDEFIPENELFNRGPIIYGENLSQKIHDFFGKHTENIFSHDTARSGRFNNATSTIIDSFNNLLGIHEDENLEIDFPANSSKDEILFLHYTNIISNGLLDNIGRKAKKTFLFVTILCDHEIHGELIVLMKMEKVFGVRYSASELTEQLDLLPDKQTALQKGAIIIKNKLIDYPASTSYRENSDIFHTKFLDRNDSTISKYFMKGFLNNEIINGNKENTKLAINHIKNQLQPYLNDNCDSTAIVEYLHENITYGSRTSVETLVTKVVHDSKLINIEAMEDKNQDIESMSALIFSKMLDQNSSSSAHFNIELMSIDKLTIIDTENSGKLLRLSISKQTIKLGEVELIIDSEGFDEFEFNDKTLIAISNSLIDRDEIAKKLDEML